ncbi:MAG: hypothetical protein NT149_00800 [Candidatus Gottesmanbacteria bacterium]|nr:hypothetical protein [Candidatus Gottesmanbacteria bacterium]
MDSKLQEALKKANTEVEAAGITDPELKKIAFSKAMDFFLRGETVTAQLSEAVPKTGSIQEPNFWITLASSTGIDEGKLKDVYSIKGKQVLLVIPSIRGETKADKQRSLAVLILLAYCNGLGYEWVSSSLLAEAASHSKLYDTSKFAKNIRKCEWFRSEGIKKALKYKLSGPGLSHAKSLLEEITK